MISRSWLAVVAVAVTACGDSSPGLVVDMSSLFSRQDALDYPVDRLTVKISGPQSGEIEVEVSPDNPVFELAPMTSGPLYIEGLAVDAAGVPSYYGDSHVVLPPNGTIEVLLYMFPAGLLDVSVLIDPEDEPNTAVVTFVTADRTMALRRGLQSPTYDATFESPTLTRVLPSGFYTFRAQVSFDGGETYEAVGPTSLEIEIPTNDTLGETLDLRDI